MKEENEREKEEKEKKEKRRKGDGEGMKTEEANWTYLFTNSIYGGKKWQEEYSIIQRTKETE